MNHVTVTGNTTPPSCVSAPRDTFTHQHACSSCGLEDVINALNLKCRTFLVRARTDRLRDSLRLCPRDVSVNIWIIDRWTQVCFTAHKKYGDGWTTDGPHFFDPLINRVNVSPFNLKGAYLDSNILQRVGGVNCKGNKDHVRFGIGQRS